MKKYAFASIILAVVIIMASVYLISVLNETPAPLGNPSFSSSPIATSNNNPCQRAFDLSISPKGIINASQGTTQQINITFTSIIDNQQTVIPIKTFELTYYSSKIDYDNWGTNNSLSFPQERYFNYSFSLTQLTLQPLMSNSTILTIKIAEDAPTGAYEFYINTGSESYTDSLYLPMTIT